MIMNLQDIEVKDFYGGKGEKILKEFLLPSLSVACAYDRITSFYNVESLLAISQGLENLFENGGKMRLIVGIHSVPRDIIDAKLQKEQIDEQIEEVRKEIFEKVISLNDSLKKQRLATIAWMIQDHLLEIKVANTYDGIGLFHSKTLIIKDADDNCVTAGGSPNESGSGLGGNFEQLMVFKSWKSPDGVKEQISFFEDLWNNRDDDAFVFDITSETEQLIMTALGNQYPNPHKNSAFGTGLIAKMSQMPVNFFVSGEIPALYMHQERAVIDALSRWPVRVLFSDEVGLGKTFEAAATLVFLMKYCNVKRCVILTPKSVLQQWQNELFENFNLNAWLFDSSQKSYISADKHTIYMGSKSPLGTGSPDLVLVSAQYARGSGNSTSILCREDAILPDLLIVDEAHSARVSRDFNGKTKKTRMYRMLEEVSKKIPHLILATATPMQKNSSEYHSTLKLLGLPNAWKKEQNYQVSLELIAKNTLPDISDATLAAGLLYSTISEMEPSFSKLTNEEKTVVNHIFMNYQKIDRYDIGAFVRKNWKSVKTAFIKLHPAHLLTVRNTRRSLEKVGYKFPKRNLIEINITKEDKVNLFYLKVDEYIRKDCFSIEEILFPDRKISLGFIKANYQQRVASSLHSCVQSLRRRLDRAEELREKLSENGLVDIKYVKDFDINSLINDIDDELLETDENISELGEAILSKNIKIKELVRAIAIECTSLNDLIDMGQILLDEVGDKKILQSIDTAIKCMQQGDLVLLFSRYTDTVDALIQEFESRNALMNVVYGVYTGKKASIIRNNIEYPSDKNTIKNELFSKNIKVLFCSDAASEGLNLQAARVLVNVDVPWTPARLEQRIGRIARLGQVAEEVDIYNVWYPNSIEARMYHRIQKRLQEANIAIGEFPEIISNSIKKVVFDDSELNDLDIKELSNIRNSIQMKALQQLWESSDTTVTSSNLMRMQLMSLCESEYKVVGSNLEGKIVNFDIGDDIIVGLTAECGMTESISLKSAPWAHKDYELPFLLLLKDNQDNPAIFEDARCERLIKNEYVLSLVNNSFPEEKMFQDEKPSTLIEHNQLNLRYAVDCELKEPPIFWPPRGDVNKNES